MHITVYFKIMISVSGGWVVNLSHLCHDRKRNVFGWLVVLFPPFRLPSSSFLTLLTSAMTLMGKILQV